MTTSSSPGPSASAPTHLLGVALPMVQWLVDPWPVMLFVKDCRRRYLVVNARWEELTGVARGQAVGTTDEILFAAATATASAQRDAQVLDTGMPVHDDVHIEHGETRTTCAVSTFLLRDQRGEAVGLAGIGIDVTGRDARLAAVERAREEARADVRARSEFLSDVSHDLRTPLNTVIGFAELLQEESLTVDQRDEVAQIRRAGEDLLAIIDGMLERSRADRR